MLKGIGNFLLQPLALTNGSFGRWGGRPATLHLGFALGQFFPHFGHSTQDNFGQSLEDVEFANRVRHIAEDRLQGRWIKRRTIGGTALKAYPRLSRGRSYPPKHAPHILIPRTGREALAMGPFARSVASDH